MDGHEAHDDSHYIRIYKILLVLFVISVVGPEVADLMGGGTIAQAIVLLTAFGIAIVKAYYVLAYFMHLNIEKRIMWYLLTISLILIGVFYFGVAPDVMNHEGQNWENCAAKIDSVCVDQRIVR